MAKKLLSRAEIQQLACPLGQAKVSVFDVSCRGLMVEVRPTGRKTFYLRYVDDHGVQRQYRLGDARDMSLDSARRMADRLRARALDGQNFAAERAARRKAPSLADFVHERYLPYVKTYKRSWQTDESLLKNHLLPNFGSRKMDTLSKRELQEFFGGLAGRHKPSTVNRVLIVLRYIYNQAIRWETVGVTSNPTASIRLLKENNQKERFLDLEEARRLYTAVCESENPLLRFIVPMLILTGARKTEVLRARWQDFDLARRNWRVPETKSGVARNVPLSDGAIDILSHVPRIPQCEYIFANPKTFQPFTSIFSAWNAARERAGLKEIRIHDLRHSFASLLVNEGRTLYEVQRILGHSQIRTTQRYAHLTNQTLVDAANVATRVFGQAMGTACIQPAA